VTGIDDLPPLREAIRRHGLSARKSLGQNFLLDLNLTARIARAGGPLDGVKVVEVGPGPGGLTRALLAQGARQVIAIERDRRAIAALAEIADHDPGRLQVIEGDALEVAWNAAAATLFSERPHGGSGCCGHAAKLRSPTGFPDVSAEATAERKAGTETAPGPLRIIANLPFNIATALLVRWLSVEPWPPWYDQMVLMFQREVAARIVAAPGSKAYGRLAVLATWRCEAKTLFDVAPSAFVPPPKVTSSVVRLVPRAKPLPCARAALERVTASAFGQRRKMLRASLRPLGGDPLHLLAAAGIDPAARAEDIPVAGFVALANALEAAGPPPAGTTQDYRS
jgi:16S rRNA (adenine1518-N6/adenine1519-N6)-dimethyltransferase